MRTRVQVRGNPSDDAACAGCLLLDHLVRYQKGKRRPAVRAADVHDVLVPLWLHKADAAKAAAGKALGVGGAGAKGRLARGQKRYRSSNTEVRAFRDLLHRLWFQARGIKEGKAAAGFTRALMLVKSGLCSQVSLYGFQTQSKGRAGKYFAKKAVVTPGHAIDWDGWLLKALMDLGFLCVYGP